MGRTVRVDWSADYLGRAYPLQEPGATVKAACMVTVWAAPAATVTSPLVAPPTIFEPTQHTATTTAWGTEMVPATDTEIDGLIGSSMNRAPVAASGLV